MNRLTAQPTIRPASISRKHDAERTNSRNENERARWDEFLAIHPSGQHVQSSSWAEIKALDRWRSRQVTVSDGGQIVGGAQILFKHVRFAGAVGYVPQGPLLLPDHEQMADQLLRNINQAAAEARLKVLFLQPPDDGPLVSKLSAMGFFACPIETAPSATLLVDLRDDFETILSRMPKGMRNQMRRSQKRGIQVCEGGRDDLPIFHQLLSATSQRRGFTTFDLEYYQGMWDILAPTGNIKLFIASLGTEPVSAQFCIPFGNRLVAKQIGWSGEQGQLHPNEALDWFTMQWAKDRGYRYYDLEGIERSAAEALLKHEPLPNEFAGTPTAYKVRLGGRPNLSPGSFCRISNPILRSIYKRIGFRIANMSFVQNAAGRFRTG